MELPFVFDNIDRCREMTGGGKNAKVLADKMSKSWINFAGLVTLTTAGYQTGQSIQLKMVPL